MSNTDKNDGIIGKFSVGLGLFDYINPILYSITSITVLSHMRGVMAAPLFWLYAAGAALSRRAGLAVPIVLYALAICLFVFLVPVGILANLKNARVHWVIEISNVLCQLSVAVGTLILF